jgi:hypothetical protein
MAGAGLWVDVVGSEQLTPWGCVRFGTGLVWVLLLVSKPVLLIIVLMKAKDGKTIVSRQAGHCPNIVILQAGAYDFRQPKKFLKRPRQNDLWRQRPIDPILRSSSEVDLTGIVDSVMGPSREGSPTHGGCGCRLGESFEEC